MKDTYSSYVMKGGKCISRAQADYEKFTASGTDEAKKTECQRQKKNNDIFFQQTKDCSKAPQFGSGCISGKDGSNGEEWAIAVDQYEASSSIITSCQQGGFL